MNHLQTGDVLNHKMEEQLWEEEPITLIRIRG